MNEREFDVFDAIESGNLDKSLTTSDEIQKELKELDDLVDAGSWKKEVVEAGFETICTFAGVPPIITTALKGAIKAGIKAAPKLVKHMQGIIDKVTGKTEERSQATPQLQEIGG